MPPLTSAPQGRSSKLLKFPPLFITATGTGVGKTYAACQLIDALCQSGYKVAAFKPIETGVSTLPEDGSQLLKTMRQYPINPDLGLETVCPIRFSLPAAPDVARGETPIDWALMDTAFKACADAADMVLIEGAGGALAPVENETLSLDIARRYHAKVLVIAPDRLGMIHDLIATLEAIKSRGFDPLWAVNLRDGDFDRLSNPWLSKHFGYFWRLPNHLPELIGTLTR